MTEHDSNVDPTSNINESTINDTPGDETTPDGPNPETGDAIENAPDDQKATADNIGDAARKVAAETAYAAAGFAGLVGEKAKAFYDEQKKQYADAHPDEDTPGARAFLQQLSDQLNRFTEELTRGYRDLAERGRGVVQSNAAARRGSVDDTSTPDSASGGTVNDGESAMTGDGPAFSSNLAEDISETDRGNDDVLRDPGKQDGIL